MRYILKLLFRIKSYHVKCSYTFKYEKMKIICLMKTNEQKQTDDFEVEVLFVMACLVERLASVPACMIQLRLPYSHAESSL